MEEVGWEESRSLGFLWVGRRWSVGVGGEEGRKNRLGRDEGDEERTGGPSTHIYININIVSISYKNINVYVFVDTVSCCCFWVSFTLPSPRFWLRLACFG